MLPNEYLNVPQEDLFRSFDDQDWIFLVTFTVMIYYLVRVCELECVQNLGPVLYTSMEPLRIVSTLLGSYLFKKPMPMMKLRQNSLQRSSDKVLQLERNICGGS